MISTCVLVALVWRMGALRDASLRMFSLWTTRAVCPTLRRLGRRVLQETSWGAGVGVSASGAAVGGSVASVAGGSVGAAVGVKVGSISVGTAEGMDVCVTSGMAVVS